MTIGILRMIQTDSITRGCYRKLPFGLLFRLVLNNFVLNTNTTTIVMCVEYEHFSWTRHF